MFLEYDKGEPIAIVEYKHENAATVNASHPTYQAMIKLGTRAGIPVFVCRYKGDFSLWVVTPLNNMAVKLLDAKPTTPTKMTEKQWVQFLYRIRGYEAPEAMFSYANIKL